MVKGEVPLKGRLGGIWIQQAESSPGLLGMWSSSNTHKESAVHQFCPSERAMVAADGMVCVAVQCAWEKSPSSSHFASLPPPPHLPHEQCAESGSAMCAHAGGWTVFSQSFFQGSLVFCFLENILVCPMQPCIMLNTVQSILPLCFWWPW